MKVIKVNTPYKITDNIKTDNLGYWKYNLLLIDKTNYNFLQTKNYVFKSEKNFINSNKAPVK